MKAAEQGLAEAQNRLGYCYTKGIGGLRSDAEKATTWYRKAAAQGSSKAQYNLAMHYESGVGVGGVDLSEAKFWYEMAAEQGDKDAEQSLNRLREAPLTTNAQSGTPQVATTDSIQAKLQSAATTTKDAASKFWERNGDGIKSSLSKTGEAIGGFYKRNQREIEAGIVAFGFHLLNQQITTPVQPEPASSDSDATQSP